MKPRREDWPASVVIGLEYAEQIVKEETAPVLVQLACRRFLDDLAEPPDGFHFDPSRPEEVIEFCLMFRHLKGPMGGKPFRLEPWQVWIVSNIFGWVDADGHRRFRQAFIALPRGNGKTTLCAVLALYLLSDGEPAPEVYSAAVSRDQARLSFDTARHMANRAPQEYREHFGIVPRRHEILSEGGAGVFKPLASDSSSLDGLSVHGAVIDEVCSHKTSEVYDVLLTATAKRANPLMFLITTATSNSSGVGKTLWDYTRKLLEGAFSDVRWFGVVWEKGPDDDPWDPEVWRKVNPGWGTSVQPAGFEAIARQAKQNAGQQAAFLQKHLNIFAGTEDALFSLKAWIDCTDTSQELEDFKGRRAFLGLDLAARVDLAALAIVIPGEEGAPTRVFCKLYIPQEAVFSERHPQYPIWVESGHLTMTPGATLDFGVVRDDVETFLELLDVRVLAYDPWGATQISNDIGDKWPELTLVEFRQTTANFTEPTRILEGMIESKGIRHDGNPVLTWNIGNVVGSYDRTGAVFPKKARTGSKIDGAVATIMALGASLFEEDPGMPEILII